MTVAALEAVALRDCLRHGADQLERRYLAAADRIVDPAWQFTAGADLAQPLVPGRRALRVRLVSAYLRRLFRSAARDEELVTVRARFGDDRPPRGAVAPQGRPPRPATAPPPCERSERRHGRCDGHPPDAGRRRCHDPVA
jgi:hypothetical protein